MSGNVFIFHLFGISEECLFHLCWHEIFKKELIKSCATLWWYFLELECISLCPSRSLAPWHMREEQWDTPGSHQVKASFVQVRNTFSSEMVRCFLRTLTQNNIIKYLAHLCLNITQWLVLKCLHVFYRREFASQKGDFSTGHAEN